ncbi:MAG: hypothetical protein JST22_15120 [Bacteroidetes bacterium]|nr:hypothetical protein [Bacteroidota bacterium]
MKKAVRGSLRSLLTESAPLRRLPVTVVRQLVGYYGDWRRSRDILNDVVDTNMPGRMSSILRRASRPHSSRLSPAP